MTTYITHRLSASGLVLMTMKGSDPSFKYDETWDHPGVDGGDIGFQEVSAETLEMMIEEGEEMGEENLQRFARAQAQLEDQKSFERWAVATAERVQDKIDRQSESGPRNRIDNASNALKWRQEALLDVAGSVDSFLSGRLATALPGTTSQQQEASGAFIKARLKRRLVSYIVRSLELMGDPKALLRSGHSYTGIAGFHNECLVLLGSLMGYTIPEEKFKKIKNVVVIHEYFPSPHQREEMEGSDWTTEILLELYDQH